MKNKAWKRRAKSSRSVPLRNGKCVAVGKSWSHRLKGSTKQQIFMGNSTTKRSTEQYREFTQSSCTSKRLRCYLSSVEEAADWTDDAGRSRSKHLQDSSSIQSPEQLLNVHRTLRHFKLTLAEHRQRRTWRGEHDPL